MSQSQPQNLLLISARPELFSVFAERVAQECGLRLDHRRTVAEASTGEAPALLFTDVDSPDTALAVERAFDGRISRNRVHYLVLKEQLEAIGGAVPGFLSGNVVVSRSGVDVSQLAPRYARVCKVALQGGASRSVELFPQGTQTQSLVIRESMQKGLAAHALNDHLSEQNINERISLMIANALDELLMNAIFDAPADAEGNQIYGATPRKVNLELKGAGTVELDIFTYERQVGIHVSDLFGTLNRDVVISHYLKGFAGEIESNSDADRAGAGIGLAMVCRSGGSLFMYCVPGQRTEITAFFDVAEKMRDFRGQPRFITTYIAEQ